MPLLHAVAATRWQCWFAGRDLWLGMRGVSMSGGRCLGADFWGVLDLGVLDLGAFGNCRAVSCVLDPDQAGAGGWQGMLS